MAAPSGTVWGSKVNDYGRIGIHVELTTTNTTVERTVQVWFWSKYSVTDDYFTLYYNCGQDVTSATSKASDCATSIKTTVDTGDGWSTSNQKKLAEYTYTYNKDTSSKTYKIYTKLTNIDRVGGTMYANTSFTVPALTKYTVSYDANGGSGAPSSQTKYYGKTLTLSSTKPQKSGYTFVGWGTSSSDTTADYSAGGSYTTNASDTLYAIWKKTIELSYNVNGGSNQPSKQSATIYNATTSSKFTISNSTPVRTGYTFLGWSTSASATSATYSAGGSITISSSTTLYAVWKIVTYTISYNANGGTGKIDDQTKNHGATIVLSNGSGFSKPGYKFIGWGTSAGDTTADYASSANYSTNANLTLYAVWQMLSPTITDIITTRETEKDENGKDILTGNAIVTFNWTSPQGIKGIDIIWASPSETAASGTKKVDVTVGDTSGSVNIKIGNDELDKEASYTITITATDVNTESIPAIRSVPLDSDFAPPIHFIDGGDGAAIGKASEKHGYFEVDLQSEFNKDIFMSANNRRIHGVDPDGNVKECFQPQNENGNTVIGYGNYERGIDGLSKEGNTCYTNVYGHDVHIGVSNTAKPGTFRPYRRQGDTIPVTIDTAGYVTNNGKRVCFTIPISMPIVGNPTITLTSTESGGFMLRQNNAYTHGSSASVYVKADTIECSYGWITGISVTANFSNITNVINNNAIGIRWIGTIKLS